MSNVIIYDTYNVNVTIENNEVVGVQIVSGFIHDVIAGTNISIDKTDPLNPIISSSGGGGSMVYPGAGIALSTGSAWGTSITDNSAVWNTAITTTGTQALTGNKIISGSGSGYSFYLGDFGSEVGDFKAYTSGEGRLHSTGTYGGIVVASSSPTDTRIASGPYAVNPQVDAGLGSGDGLVRMHSNSNAGRFVIGKAPSINSGNPYVILDLTPSSDATGDIYYRNSSGFLSRLAAGTDTHVLTLASGIPSWAAPSTTDATKLPLIGATYTTTTGNGLDITSSTVTSGNLVSITNTGTAAASDTKTALYVASSGANGTSGQDTYAARFSNTGTGTTSKNVGIGVGASGGTTNNAIEVSAGNVVLNQSGNQSITKSGGSLTVGTSDFNSFGLAVNGVTRMSINGSSGIFTFTTNSASSGSHTAYSYTDAARANQTASTETHFTNWTPNATQFATGAMTMLRTFRMNPATYAFVASSTITDAYGLWVASPIAGTNATITNNWSAGFDGNVQISGTRVNMANLPTSAAGLSAGDIWNNTGVINIV